MDPAIVCQLRSWLEWRMRYPFQSVALVQKMCPELLRRLLGNLDKRGGGCCMDSDYSGTGGAHDAMAFLFLALAPFFRNSPILRHYRACDLLKTNPAAICLLCGRDETCLIEHVFDDLNQRLPLDVQTMLDQLDPPADATAEERRQLYRGMLDVRDVYLLH